MKQISENSNWLLYPCSKFCKITIRTITEQIRKFLLKTYQLFDLNPTMFLSNTTGVVGWLVLQRKHSCYICADHALGDCGDQLG